MFFCRLSAGVYRSCRGRVRDFMFDKGYPHISEPQPASMTLSVLVLLHAFIYMAPLTQAKRQGPALAPCLGPV